MLKYKVAKTVLFEHMPGCTNKKGSKGGSVMLETLTC